MANPRKFSEKIAIQIQKQAEETAAFEQIMREVIGVTRVSNQLSFTWIAFSFTFLFNSYIFTQSINNV